jgi:hypothetical protein
MYLEITKDNQMTDILEKWWSYYHSTISIWPNVTGHKLFQWCYVKVNNRFYYLGTLIVDTRKEIIL